MACVQQLLGSATAPSFYDVLFVNRLYGCKSECFIHVTASIALPKKMSVTIPGTRHSSPSPSLTCQGSHPSCYWAPGCRCACPERWRESVCSIQVKDAIKQGEETHIMGNEGGNLSVEEPAVVKHFKQSDAQAEATKLSRQGFEVDGASSPKPKGLHLVSAMISSFLGLLLL